MKTKKIFISLPMKGVPFKEILYNIDCMESKLLKEMHADPKRFGMVDGDEIQFVTNARGTSHPADDYKYPPLWYLGQAIQRMGDCDYIAFDTDCEKAKGCLAEFEVARIYNIPMIFLGDESSTIINQETDEHTIHVDKKPRVPDKVVEAWGVKWKACDPKTGTVDIPERDRFNKSLSFARKEAEWFFVNLLGSKMVEKEDVQNCNDMVDAIIDAAVLKYEWKKSILEGKDE